MEIKRNCSQEKYIQNKLKAKYVNNGLSFPNTYLYEWESDYIRLTNSGYIYEYEIKISRNDFNREFKKDKYIFLNNGFERPNYIYFVCPVDLITCSDLPDYIGLIYLIKNRILKTIKKAELIHTKKASIKQRNTLMKSIHNKYWDWRLKGE